MGKANVFLSHYMREEKNEPSLHQRNSNKKTKPLINAHTNSFQIQPYIKSLLVRK